MGMNIGPGGPYQPPKPTQPSQTGQANPNAPLGSQDEGPMGPSIPLPVSRLVGELLLSPLHAQQTSMTSVELSIFLRSILQMPKEIQQLLAMLGQGEQKQVAVLLKQLLADNPGLLINLTDLQNVLKKSVKDGENRLMQVLQSSQAGLTGSSKTMGDLIGLLGQLSSHVALSPTEALNTALTLYLPWHPLADQQRLNMQFQQGGDGEGEGQGGDSHLVLLIDTNTLGRFHVLILPIQGLQVLLHIQHDPVFTQHEGMLQTELDIAFVQNGLLKPDYAFKTRPESAVTASNEAPTEALTPPQALTESKQAVVVQPASQVPALVIQSAYIVARVIFELDNRLALDQKRQNQI